MLTFFFRSLTSCLFITAGYGVIVERVYDTKVTIGPGIANDLSDLLLDDFTGDGLPDLITANGISPILNFVENEGQGLFGSSRAVDSSIRWSANAYAVASGDFNNDGYNDFVVVTSMSAVRIYWNDPGNPGFFNDFTDVSLDVMIDNASGVDMDIQVADMHGDGFQDIILTVYERFKSSNTMLLVLENDGNGVFTDINMVSDDLQGASTIAIGDYNADGIPDIAINARKRNMVFVYINNDNYDGTFERKIVDISASSNKAIASGDVNGDGYDDLLCQGQDTTTLYLNNQDGTFRKLFQYEVDGRFLPSNRRVQIFDVDEDGLMDLVSMAGEIIWQRQISSDPLTFSMPLYINAETAPKPIPGSALSDEKFLANGFAFRDVNGDGIVDFIACENSSPSSVYAFLGDNVKEKTPLSTNAPTKSPTQPPITTPPVPLPTNEPTRHPTKQPITTPPVLIVTKPPIRSPTKQPVTTPQVPLPTEQPTDVPSPTTDTKTTLDPLPSQIDQTSETPSEFIMQKTTNPTNSVVVVNVKFGAIVSTDTNVSHLEKVFTESMESVLRNSSQFDFMPENISENVTNDNYLKELNTTTVEDLQSDVANLTQSDTGRGLMPNEDGFFNHCFIAEEGSTDEQCRTTSNGTFSYKCVEETRYVCCTEDRGLTVASAMAEETCYRNGPLFDAKIHSIGVSVMEVECATLQLYTVIEEERKCILVETALSGGNSDDLVVLKQIVVNSTNNGIFDSTITSNGLDAVVFHIISGTKSSTFAPSTSPTIVRDTCTLFSDNCTSCVANKDCLWCHDSGFCFNADPAKRVTTSTNGLSRFLEPTHDVCSDIYNDGSTLTCTASHSTNSLDKLVDSSSVPKLKTWCCLASGFVMGILLYLL